MRNLKALFVAITIAISASFAAQAQESDTVVLESLAATLIKLEREAQGFSTFYTRQALKVSTYDEYMNLYPKIVDETEERASVLSRENFNYLMNIPATATTCSFTSSW